MSFQSGRVSFNRYRVLGDMPVTVEQAVLASLQQFSFQESPLGRPDEVESGFTTGEHIFDTQFTYEKNGFGDMMLLALRVDTNKVPAEVRLAYRRMNEAALAAGNPSGHTSKKQKFDAKDTADQQMHADLAAGKFRRSKNVALLWDLQNRCLYCSATGTVVAEQLRTKLHDAFNVDLEPLTAGGLAGEFLREKGLSREYEDLRPSPFTEPPASAREGHEGDASSAREWSVPRTPWSGSNHEFKDFLGNEFLIWLWHSAEAAEGIIEVTAGTGKAQIAVVPRAQLEMDCAWAVEGKQTLRADAPTHLAEAAEALRGGKWPRKMGLILGDVREGHQWELSLQGDRLAVSSASLPPSEEAQSTRELIEHRLLQTRTLADTIDQLFAAFLGQRLATGWPTRRGVIRKWIQHRRKSAAAKES